MLTWSTAGRGHSAPCHSNWALLVSLDAAAGADLVGALLVSCRNGSMRHGFAKHQNREERCHARTAPTCNVSYLFFYKVMFRTSDEPLWNTPPSLEKTENGVCSRIYRTHSQQLASFHMHKSCRRTRHTSHLE